MLNDDIFSILRAGFDSSSRSEHISLLWGRRDGTVVWPKDENQLHKRRMQRCTLSPENMSNGVLTMTMADAETDTDKMGTECWIIGQQTID